MKRLFALALMAFLFSAGHAGKAAAQDLVITNARIIVGNGDVIENGSIVIRDGRIASVAPGRADAAGVETIDAGGMSALPGFIDAHKHINTGPDEAEQMQSLLEAGYTTVLSGGGPGDGSLTLRDHIESGMINGPRIIPSERVNLRGTPEEGRATIRDMAARGIFHTGEIGLTPEPGPTPEEIEVLEAIVDEAARAGVQVNVHAVSTSSMVGAIDAGVRRLVHLPNKDWVSREAAEKVASTDSIVLGLIGFGAPIIDVFEDDNSPRFRNGEAWPEAIAGANRDAEGRATGTEAGYTLVNARTIWDASGGTGIAYCTDQNYADVAVLEHELKSYNIMFSMQDIIRIMGPNSAAYIDMEDDLGTLEEGKLADMILLDGNPLEGYWNMLNTKLTIVGGEIRSDER